VHALSFGFLFDKALGNRFVGLNFWHSYKKTLLTQVAFTTDKRKQPTSYSRVSY
jgi:hypothetical protein